MESYCLYSGDKSDVAIASVKQKSRQALRDANQLSYSGPYNTVHLNVLDGIACVWTSALRSTLLASSHTKHLVVHLQAREEERDC